MRKLLLAISLICFCLPQTSVAQNADLPMNAQESVELLKALTAMGYAPEIPDRAKPSSILLNAGGAKVLVIQGGCIDGKKCRYLVLYKAFDDVSSVDPKLLNKLNADYDLIKMWVADDGSLAYTLGLMAEGLTRSHFRATMDHYLAAAGQLAQDLVSAKAVKEQPSAAKP